MGIGASLFLMALKAMTIFFIGLTILNYPIMTLYMGKSYAEGMNIFQASSLGNLAQSQYTCSEVDIRNDESVELKCFHGKFREIVNFGVPRNEGISCQTEVEDFSISMKEGC